VSNRLGLLQVRDSESTYISESGEEVNIEELGQTPWRFESHKSHTAIKCAVASSDSSLRSQNYLLQAADQGGCHSPGGLPVLLSSTPSCGAVQTFDCDGGVSGPLVFDTVSV
jgi:hypothetical protein